MASETVNGMEASLTSTGNTDNPAEIAFTAIVNLNRGPNEVESIATDTSGKTTTDTRTVYRDAGPPKINWIPDDGSTSSTADILVEGIATDDAGIDSITENGESVDFVSTNNPDDPSDVSFSVSFTLILVDSH